jgi:enoyl-[acyl-carrier protein] reductase II
VKRIDALWNEGKIFLGTELPILAGAMTWISDSRFVASVCNHGAFGCLAAGNMPPELLDGEIRALKELTDKPFGVNLITIAPNYKDHLKVALANRVPFVIFAGSYPRRPEIQAARDGGARVISFASTETLARRLIDMGVDALILEGSEAGGHVGHVSLGILLQQVLFKVHDVPIFVAGGIAHGAYMTHLLLMGAAGIQMGTFFVMTDECRAHEAFKQAFARARAREAVSTPQISSDLKVIPVRALRNKGLDEFNELQMELIQKRKKRLISHSEAQYEVEKYWTGALRRAVQDGDVDHGSLMAGQSVGLVNRCRPLKEALEDFLKEAEAELDRMQTICQTLGSIGRQSEEKPE